MGMLPSTNDAKIIIVGSAVVLVVLYLAAGDIKRGVVAGAEAVGEGLNPVKETNWINQFADYLYDNTIGTPDNSLTSMGDDFWDWTN